MVVPGRAENETIKTVTSKFQLVHYLQNCALTTSGKQLPKWAYEQQEVSCNPNIRDKNALWNIEDNVFEKCEWVDGITSSEKPLNCSNQFGKWKSHFLGIILLKSSYVSVWPHDE